METNTETLLKAVLSVCARSAFPPDKLLEIIGPGEKQRNAFNLCDGTHNQTEIVKKLKLDSGNFNRTLARWVDAGIVFKIGNGRDVKLLHVFPLTKEMIKKTKQGA